ncbi:PAS domain-containing protein [Flavitalea flava]
MKDLRWEEIIHPDDWAQNRQTWSESIQLREYFTLEHRFLRYDGLYQ